MTTSVQASAPAPGAPGRDAGRRGLRNALGALAGLLAAAVALGFAELTAALVGPASSPVIAVGDTVITLTPEPVKEFAIRNFGENDKIVLVAGTLVVIALYALLLGLVALRSRPPRGPRDRAVRRPGRRRRHHAARRQPARRPAVDRRRGRRDPRAPGPARPADRADRGDPGRPAARPAEGSPTADGTHADERMVDRLREVLGLR